MTNAYTFRAKSSIAFFVVTLVLLILIFSEAIFVRQSLGGRITSLGWGTLIGVGSYLIFYRPKVVVFDEGITIINPVSEITVGWADVEAIETKYSMSIDRDGKRFYAWAAPAPGRHHRRTVDPTEMRGMGQDGLVMVRPGDDPDTLSGSAAAIARRRWAQYQSGAPSAHFAIQRRLIGPLILVVAAAAVLLVS